MAAMSEEARKKRQAYMREYMTKYRKQNPDKIKEINNRHWENKMSKERD